MVTQKRCLSGHTEISQRGKTFLQVPVNIESTLNIDTIHIKDPKIFLSGAIQVLAILDPCLKSSLQMY